MILFIAALCLALGYTIATYRQQFERGMSHRAILYREDNAYYIQVVQGPMTGLRANLYPSDMRFEAPLDED